MTGFAEPGASRDGYGDALLDMAGDERVVVLSLIHISEPTRQP